MALELGSIPGPSRVVRGNPYQTWMAPMVPDSGGLRGLGFLPAIPLAVWGYGGLAATAGLVGAHLAAPNEELKSKERFNGLMRWMSSEIKILDKDGWKNDRCGWQSDKSTRARWVGFMNRFGTFYRGVGTVKVFVSDGEVAQLKALMAEFQKWLAYFETTCKATVGPGDPTKPTTALGKPKPCSWWGQITGECKGPDSDLDKMLSLARYAALGGAAFVAYKALKK